MTTIGGGPAVGGGGPAVSGGPARRLRALPIGGAAIGFEPAKSTSAGNGSPHPPAGENKTMAVLMSPDEFEDLVAEALDLVPVEFTKAMDNVVVLVEDRHPTQNLYGLYHGVALTSRTSSYSGHLPDTITIYRLPILAHARDVQAAREQVATTVIHEIAHHFGIDDDRLDELGWA